MITKTDIEKEVADIQNLKNLADVYGEIASIRMMKVRGYVLSNREFVSSIKEIFEDSLAFYQNKIIRLREQKNRGILQNPFPFQKNTQDGGKITFLSHNGKTVSVLISANTGFYGGVVQSTFAKFNDDQKEGNSEVTIIGSVGRQLFLGKYPKKPYTYFHLPDYGIDKAKLAEVIKHLVQYEEIKIYFGKYISVLKQEPGISRITAGTQIGSNVKKDVSYYIFEPTIEKVLMFFEQEIFAGFFDQALRESQLAKFASRIFAMDRASQNITTRLDKLKFAALRLKHEARDKKQLNSLSSIIFNT